MIIKPFYNLSPEILRIMTRQKKKFDGLSDSPHKEYAGDDIIPILHKKAFVTRHLF